MFYTWIDDGHFTIEPPLKPEHARELHDFFATRHTERDEREWVEVPGGGWRWAVHEGPFDPSIWCSFKTNFEGDELRPIDSLEWGGTVYPDAVAKWLHVIAKRFLEPWGYRLNGFCHVVGESRRRMRTRFVVCANNRVTETIVRTPQPREVQKLSRARDRQRERAAVGERYVDSGLDTEMLGPNTPDDNDIPF